MKGTWIIACLIAAFDSYQYGAGEQPQELFSGDAMWLWYVVSIYWVVMAIRTLLMEIYT